MRSILAIIVMIILFLPCITADAEKEVFSAGPVLNNGEKWRIGYYEGGEYYDYKGWFVATIKGLMELGWIEQATIPVNLKDECTEEVWNWLTTEMKSKYLTFVKDAHYSAHWDSYDRVHTVDKLINKLNYGKDIDMMLAFGTWAGRDLANNHHSTNTIIISASDAVGAGIIKSNHDSGFNHIHAHVDPNLYARQVKIFYNTINFKKLGVAYENTVNGRSYAAIDTIKKIAKKEGFEIVPCFTKSDIADKATEEDSVLKCFKNLSYKVDALYITQQGGVTNNTIPKIVAIANKKHIPTFSQAGAQEVKAGVFMSMSNSGFKYVGQYHAGVIAKVFNGAKPRELGQVFEGPPKVALNLTTTQAIKFNPPIMLFGIMDEIYE